MRIYIDFDDVISETASKLCDIANRLFGKSVKYEEIFEFNLQVSFDLTSSQITELMDYAHTDELISSYAETPGAVDTIKRWISLGHDVEIVTGRPPSTAAATKEWLARRGLNEIKIIFVDKFRREPLTPPPGVQRALTPEEFASYRYDFAVEDSPHAFPILAAIHDCRVAVYSRPWNRKIPLPANFMRCKDWNEISKML